MAKGEIRTIDVFKYINTVFMLFVLLVTIYPMVYIVSISLSSPHYVQANMVRLYPMGFNIEAYKRILEYPVFWIAYKNTLVYTVVGTLVNLVFTCTLAFCLSRRELIFRKQITILIIFTMFFGGGLIPNYLLVGWLGIYNTMWAVILPGTINTYNMIIMRTYMQGIPEEVLESVRIDGGNDLQIYTKIIIPLSKPIIVTIGLFYAVAHWNSFFGPMIYFKDKIKQPLQVILKEMIVEQDLQGLASDAVLSTEVLPTNDMFISASIILALIPIVAIYPFVQKYFVKGVMIGSLKG